MIRRRGARRRALGLRAAQAFAALGIAACGALGPDAAQAAENGTGFYLLGGRGPMAGYLPPPGVYFESDSYSYDAKLDAQKSFPAGEIHPSCA